MSIARMPRGGGQRFNDDLVRWAMVFAGLLMILFFLLLARLFFDRLSGKTVKFAPVRNPSGVIRAVLDERSVKNN